MFQEIKDGRSFNSPRPYYIQLCLVCPLNIVKNLGLCYFCDTHCTHKEDKTIKCVHDLKVLCRSSRTASYNLFFNLPFLPTSQPSNPDIFCMLIQSLLASGCWMGPWRGGGTTTTKQTKQNKQTHTNKIQKNNIFFMKHSLVVPRVVVSWT